MWWARLLNVISGLLAGGAAAGGGTSYESIATVTVGSGGSSSISFSSIPSTYKHLQLRGITRDGSAYNDITSLKLTFNSDTSSTYIRHYLLGDGNSAAAGSDQTTGFMYLGALVQNNTTANVFGGAVVDILDYQNANKYKTVRNLSGADLNGSGKVMFTSGLWQSTSAITSISLSSPFPVNLNQYSQFALYGIKG